MFNSDKREPFGFVPDVNGDGKHDFTDFMILEEALDEEMEIKKRRLGRYDDREDDDADDGEEFDRDDDREDDD